MWQIMPETGLSYGLKTNWWVDERKDVIKSTRAAARHFRELHNQVQSWPLVLAAYNGGGGKIRRAMISTGSEDFWDLKESAHIHRETKSFVPKYMAAALLARNPEAYGFRVPNPDVLRYDEVVIWESMDLTLAAYYTGSTYRIIKKLNPEIIGRYTPPDIPGYVLKIPEGTRNIFIARSMAIQKAALQLQGSDKGRISPLQLIKQRDSWTGHDPCAMVGRKNEIERTGQPVRFWTAIQDNHGVGDMPTGMNEKIMAACVLDDRSPRKQVARQ
jgi:hypothetical protein